MKVNKSAFSKHLNEEMYDKFVLTLRRHLLEGNTITFKNIGTFSTVTKPAKTMMVGGVETEVEESIRIKFKQSRNFKPRIVQADTGNMMENIIKEMKDR